MLVDFARYCWVELLPDTWSQEFKSPDARQAEMKFLAAIKSARDACIADRNAAAKGSLKADDLDESLQIKEKIEDRYQCEESPLTGLKRVAKVFRETL